ncbi:aminoglycoside phosphotransferase family protein [Oerskovia rustica]|uniref:Aminoglycoside phosphotransferase family protein n=1 Tax=Oerskovia rustica TaxID=2762237 RepID=A0ABR8RPQ6_9CELL|nr:aminoglycoside phosphotransferase family protein [Oerskovia rustica]MBD7949772.1 aminoglycoside phosphotransferase family protein [Oerskovia rustica]
MAFRPPAEVDVTTGLVRALLAAQHPDLADLPLTVVANGWDNVVLRLGDDLAVRVPRREAAAELVRHEQEWLPVLASRLPVAVPAPVRVGLPSDDSTGPASFPWSWSVVPWFDGLSALAVDRALRRAFAPELAAFLAALHVPAPPEAPANPFRGVPLAARDASVRERLLLGHVPDDGALLDLWSRLVEVPAWGGPALWLHGDLHPANLVLAPGDHRLGAVVDFGDMTSGDPATDLATAWITFDAAGRRIFRETVTARCGTDDATWERARAWALVIGTAFAAHSDDDPAFADLGAQTLAQVLGDD